MTLRSLSLFSLTLSRALRRVSLSLRLCYKFTLRNGTAPTDCARSPRGYSKGRPDYSPPFSRRRRRSLVRSLACSRAPPNDARWRSLCYIRKQHFHAHIYRYICVYNLFVKYIKEYQMIFSFLEFFNFSLHVIKINDRTHLRISVKGERNSARGQMEKPTGYNNWRERERSDEKNYIYSH